MISEKGKIIFLICCIFSFFIIEQFALSIDIRLFKKLAIVIYPSISFWISLLAGLWSKRKFNLDVHLLIKISFIAAIVSWVITFALIPIYLPVTSFKPKVNAVDIYDIFYLLSISLYKSGWTLIVLLIIWRKEIRDVH